jgi:hypothetical protein
LPNWSALAISRLLTQCKIVACCRITASFPFPIGLGRANIQSACMRPHIQIYNQLVGETKLNSNTIEAPLAKVHAQCRRVRADCTTRFPDTRSRNMIDLQLLFILASFKHTTVDKSSLVLLEARRIGLKSKPMQMKRTGTPMCMESDLFFFARNLTHILCDSPRKGYHVQILISDSIN